MIKAVIFDLDNTLIDFMKMKRIACEQAIDAMIDGGLSLDRKTALSELYKLYFEIGLEDKEIFQKFLEKVSGDVDFRLLARGIVAYRDARTGFLRPYPKTRSTLLELKKKGLKLAIVSDAPRIKAWIRLVHMQIDELFDVVVACDDTGETKPSVLPFKSATSQLGVDSEECLMVGDMPGRDVAGAKKLGMKTCFARYGYEGKEKADADFVIDKVEDLLKVVDNS